MTGVPVTVLKIETVGLSESILEQIPILKPEDKRGWLEYDAATNQAHLDTQDGALAMDVLGYVWRPDSVGHRACYWVLVKMANGFLGRVHVFSRHSRSGSPPPVLRGMKQIYIVDGNGE